MSGHGSFFEKDMTLSCFKIDMENTKTVTEHVDLIKLTYNIGTPH